MGLREDFRYRTIRNRMVLPNERTGPYWILRDVFYYNQGYRHLFGLKQFQLQTALEIELQALVWTGERPMKYGPEESQTYHTFGNSDAKHSV